MAPLCLGAREARSCVSQSLADESIVGKMWKSVSASISWMITGGHFRHLECDPSPRISASCAQSRDKAHLRGDFFFLIRFCVDGWVGVGSTYLGFSRQHWCRKLRMQFPLLEITSPGLCSSCLPSFRLFSLYLYPSLQAWVSLLPSSISLTATWLSLSLSCVSLSLSRTLSLSRSPSFPFSCLLPLWFRIHLLV